MDPTTSINAMDDTTQPLTTTDPPANTSSTASPFSTSSAFSTSSPSFPSISSSESSQSAPSSFSSTFSVDPTTTAFTQSSPSFTPFSFPAVPNTSDTASTTPSAAQPGTRRPYRPTSTGSKPILLHAGTKRGSLSRDDYNDDEDDDGIEDDMPVRPLKRLHETAYGTGEADEDGEEDDDDGQHIADYAEDEEFKAIEADDADADADGAEDTFSNLLTHFAALHVPTSSNKPEQCPICNQTFPMSEFADHVYSCLTVLDDVEKKEQERLDEKMARQLMAREVRLLDESERHSSYSRDRHALGSECAQGAQCQRTDAQHFQLRTHPDVGCPVCGVMFPLFDINAHVSACLGEDAGGEGKQGEGEAAGGMDDEMSGQQQQQQHERESRAKAAIDTSSSAFSSFRADKQRGDMADDDSHLPIARDSDDEDDDRKNSPSPPLDAALNRTASASPPPASASNLRLTVEQASAVASMIKEKREKGGDESVAAMLETFRQLGFTQENLTRLKEEQAGRGKADEMDRKG